MMRLTSLMACAVLALGLIVWVGCDNADNARTGNDANNTAPDVAPGAVMFWQKN